MQIIRGVLHTILGDAIAKGVIFVNPLARVRRFDVPERELKYLDVRQLKLLCEKVGSFYAVLFPIMAFAGLVPLLIAHGGTLNGPNPLDFVFPSQMGTPLYPRNVRRRHFLPADRTNASIGPEASRIPLGRFPRSAFRSRKPLL